MDYDVMIRKCECQLEKTIDQICLQIDKLDLRTEQQLEIAFNWVEDQFSGWEDEAIAEVEFRYDEELEDILAEQLIEKYGHIRILKNRIHDRYLDCIGCGHK